MSNNQSLYFYRDFLNDNANISARNRNEMIALSHSFRDQKLLIFTLFILALWSLFTLIMLYVVFKSKEVRRIFSLTHLDLKFIVITGGLTYLLSSINSLLFFSYQLSILLILDFGPSFYISSGTTCFWSQNLFVSLCPLVSILVCAAMFLERCYISMCCDRKRY